jgi:hypothetical protein
MWTGVAATLGETGQKGCGVRGHPNEGADGRRTARRGSPVPRAPFTGPPRVLCGRGRTIWVLSI